MSRIYQFLFFQKAVLRVVRSCTYAVLRYMVSKVPRKLLFSHMWILMLPRRKVLLLVDPLATDAQCRTFVCGINFGSALAERLFGVK